MIQIKNCSFKREQFLFWDVLSCVVVFAHAPSVHGALPHASTRRPFRAIRRIISRYGIIAFVDMVHTAGATKQLVDDTPSSPYAPWRFLIIYFLLRVPCVFKTLLCFFMSLCLCGKKFAVFLQCLPVSVVTKSLCSVMSLCLCGKDSPCSSSVSLSLWL